MRERQRQQRPGRVRGPGDQAEAAAGLPQPAMAEHDALRPAGRAAGVEQGREVVVGARLDLDRFAALQVGERIAPAVVPDHERGDVQSLRGAAEQRHQLRADDRGRGPGVGQDVPQLRHGLQEDHRRHDGAGPPDRAVGDEHLRGVHHHHDHPVARRHAVRAQTARDPRRPLVDLPRGQPPALEEQRLVVAEAFEGLLGEHGEVVLSRSGHRRRRREPRDLVVGRHVVTEEEPVHLGPAPVQVRVVLPGEPDAAVHLDHRLGRVFERGGRGGLGGGRGQGQLVWCVVGGPCRPPDQRAELLHLDVDVDEQVLDRLVGADRAAEGVPLLRVLHADLQDAGGGTETLGGEDRPADALAPLPQLGRVRHQLRGLAEGDVAEAAGRVDRLARRDGPRSADQRAVPQCQEGVGADRVQDGTAVVDDRDRQLAAGEVGQPGVAGQQHRRPREGHQRRAGEQASGLLGHHGEVEDAAATPARHAPGS